MSDPQWRIADSGQLAGAATLVWGNGAAQTTCFGWRDIERKLPVERDTIFRIASMTKPITSVAALMLVDEGRVALNDPIARYAPEFSQMRVLRSPGGPLGRACLMGTFIAGRSRRCTGEALGGDIDSNVVPDDWITRLSQLPLIHQPGAIWSYGRATDLLGLLIARIEGEPLGAVLQRRIFDPTGYEGHQLPGAS